MRLLIHDFAGHPFAADLSRSLARRGHEVCHAYCGGVTTGRGGVSRRPGDPGSLRFLDVSDVPFERYAPFRRLRSEIDYGRRAATLVRGLRPDAVVSANTPLAAQALLWRASRHVGARRVYWLQDFLGRGTRSVLRDRSRVVGATFGRSWEALETRLLRRSDAIVAITPDFRPELSDRRVDVPVHVIENWAPLDEIVARPKVTPWSSANGLAERPVALYSGTLGLKHDPEHLVAAATALGDLGGIVVVVSEGLGRDRLDVRKRQLGLDNLLLLDFVDYELFPEVLGAAEVCLVLLEPDAGAFSVPSKVLTYLAAGRSVVGAIPRENLAARTIEHAGAGVVVRPGDHDEFALATRALLEDSARRHELGRAARRYAEARFDVARIADEFEALLAG